MRWCNGTDEQNSRSFPHNKTVGCQSNQIFEANPENQVSKNGFSCIFIKFFEKVQPKEATCYALKQCAQEKHKNSVSLGKKSTKTSILVETNPGRCYLLGKVSVVAIEPIVLSVRPVPVP